MSDQQVTLGGKPTEPTGGVVITDIHPVIISVSRATDIPAFYMDWFLHRYHEGYVIWKNPYRQNRRQRVLFDKTRAAVFWTKDPGSLLASVDAIDALSLHYYVQVTLNDYEGLGYELRVPPLEKRIHDFQDLSRRLGKERVIWRFDPLLLSDTLTIESLFVRIEELFARLGPYCERMVFSYVDIAGYRGVTRNMARYGLTAVREFTGEEKLTLARVLEQCAKPYRIQVMACCQELDLLSYGIIQGRCIDDRLFRRIASGDPDFISWLDRSARKDAGQREHCTCIVAKDVGEYSTCLHQCRYCYANRSDEVVASRYLLHQKARSQGLVPESIVPEY
ncbi:MAG: DUF1848 domain-containing protein [Methanospirillum sp.]|uniref:DUF1848 domain-containing protein n=1 Tax=Methanospirillum sp. TaxID=45200 RepID=UPI0023747646|nr:DUF1848 domain-containing protein [Methanospirillum sp.]MDD1729956.1 DUF1848 domain-containing protein [Methanospirillum sp.]